MSLMWGQQKGGQQADKHPGQTGSWILNYGTSHFLMNQYSIGMFLHENSYIAYKIEKYYHTISLL